MAKPGFLGGSWHSGSGPNCASTEDRDTALLLPASAPAKLFSAQVPSSTAPYLLTSTAGSPGAAPASLQRTDLLGSFSIGHRDTSSEPGE